MESKVKKLNNKQIKVSSYDILNTKEVSNLNRFKRFICKVLKIEPSTLFRYHIRIKYYGSARIQPRDVLTDSIGNIYTVLDEKSRLARIINYTPLKSKPNLNGVLNIEGRSTEKMKK